MSVPEYGRYWYAAGSAPLPKTVEDIVSTYAKYNVGTYDGDLCLVVNDPVIMSGVDRNASVVIDVEDKVTALKEEYNIQNRTNCIIRSLRSSIGEISNYASAYHNKAPKTQEQKKRYEGYVDLLSVVNGKQPCRCKTVWTPYQRCRLYGG